MEIPTLKVKPRSTKGSREATRLRKAGLLPAIVYGHKQTPEPVALSYRDVEQHLHHGLHIVKLDHDGQIQPCQFKELQFDHLGSTLLHIDLVRVDLTERIHVKVPLEFRGTAKGTQDGGVFYHELTEMEIVCVVTEIPDSIRIDITNMGLDQILHVKEIPLPTGATTEMDPDQVVAMVRVPQELDLTAAATPAAEGATPAEPEVIAKGKEPKEEGAEE